MRTLSDAMELFKLRCSYQGFPQAAHHAGSPPPIGLSKAHHECSLATAEQKEDLVSKGLWPLSQIPSILEGLAESPQSILRGCEHSHPRRSIKAYRCSPPLLRPQCRANTLGHAIQQFMARVSKLGESLLQAQLAHCWQERCQLS